MVTTDKIKHYGCKYTTFKLTELKRAHPKDTDVKLYVDNEMSYKTMFDGLAYCAGLDDDKDQH